MNRKGQSGKIQTVLGTIEPEALGVTLTHEHLLIDLECYFELPEEASERAWVHAPVTMDRLGGLTKRFYNLDNMKLLDTQVAIEEVLPYKYAGGHSLVDTTSIGISRDPLALARISRATGLNVIMGASHYVPLSYPDDMDSRSEEDIADEIIRDVTVGVGDTGVRSGVIGEVGNFWPMTDNQRKVLRASGYAQKETGAAVTIHPGTDTASPPQILGVLVDAGADPGKVIMGHLDSYNDTGMLEELVDAGCYVQWDIFGFEDSSFDSLAGQPIEPFTDVQRMQKMEFMAEQGFGDRILAAHDVCVKRHYRRYGGKSYDHILDNVVPRMRRRGFSQDLIRNILVENPRRALTFK